jgi:hypothetical protein
VVAFREIEPQRGSLGNSADISATGENTVKKFALLDHERILLGAADLRNSKGKNKGNRPHRTRLCHAYRAYGADTIKIRLNQNPSESRASFSGLQTCGSIWACPVCASREAAEKGEFILKALQWAKRANKKAFMLTLTARHHVRMTLEELETKFKAAWETFTAHRSWKKLKKELGIEHWIAAIEAPYGENGWHYHKHVLLFADFDMMKESETQADFVSLWIRCLEIHGLEALPERAAKITTGAAVGNSYLTKCGITVTESNGRLEYEMTGSQNKESKNQWELLEMSYYGNTHAGDLFIEFVSHMTGKKFLTTSHGLGDLVALEELAAGDEASSEDSESSSGDEMQDFAEISPYWWDIVRDTRSMSDVLKVAAKTRNVNRVRELLWELQERLITIGELDAYHRQYRFIAATSADFAEGIRRIFHE